MEMSYMVFFKVAGRDDGDEGDDEEGEEGDEEE